jgi:hypothetical protein
MYLCDRWQVWTGTSTWGFWWRLEERVEALDWRAQGSQRNAAGVCDTGTAPLTCYLQQSP